MRFPTVAHNDKTLNSGPFIRSPTLFDSPLLEPKYGRRTDVFVKVPLRSDIIPLSASKFLAF